MNSKHYADFKKAKNLGLKVEAKVHIEKFIQSFNNLEEKTTWVHDYLESRDFCHKIRHELYEAIIFPVLLSGYQQGDAWSLYWLAETHQNFYQAEKLHVQINFISDYELLKKCFDVDNTNDRVRLALLERIERRLDYLLHEWPAGILYAPDESAEEVLQEIEYARQLDKELKYVASFEEAESIIHEDQSRNPERHQTN